MQTDFASANRADHPLFGVAVAVFIVLVAQPVVARPTYLTAWQNAYPASTLPARITAANGNACWICHHPSALDNPGNCYRLDLGDLIVNQGQTIGQAIAAVDAIDSDGDGVANGVEILAPRVDQPGAVGYSPGLVGAMGIDPCFNPATPITNQLETPPPPVPAMGTWGLVATLGLITFGASKIVRRT